MKMIKKLGKSIIAMTLSAACLSGCVKEEEKLVRNVHEGTYTETADGYLGGIIVNVTFSEGLMTKAEVISHNESVAIADDAIENIPKYVVENQSVNVDVSTGATITSNAILSAIKSAIEEAGGDLSEWQDDAIGKHETDVEQIDTDVIVIGAGASGIATVLRLQELGYDTVLIEKTATLGGALNYQETPSQIVIEEEEKNENSLLQPDSNEPKAETSEELKEDILTLCEGANEELVTLLTDELAETVVWQKEILGLEFEDEYVETDDYQGYTLKYFDLSGGDIPTLYGKEAEVSGSNILSETGVIELIQDGQDIQGVKAKSSDGTYYEITSDVIVFATGSGSNVAGALMYGPEGNSGDAVFIASGTGLSYFPTTYSYSSYPSIDNSGNGLDVYEGLEKALSRGAFLMNGFYERFVKEDNDQETLYKAALNQDATYLVMNQSAFEAFISTIDDEEGTIETSLAQTYGGSTLMDACSKVELDASKLVNLVNKFNHMVKGREDTDYGRDASTLKNVIENDEKVYIIPLYTYCFDTNDGFEVSNRLHVKTIDGEELNNVYAVGSVAGNVFGNTLPGGAGNAWAFVSGKYVADEIATTLVKE